MMLRLVICVTLGLFIGFTSAQDTFVLNIGMHLFGGTVQSSLTTASTCLAGCASTTTCLAADFNDITNLCYYHNSSTACGTLSSKASCINFMLAACSADTHILGGVQQTGISDANTCLESCRNSSSTCLAVDFNGNDSTCFFHNSTTACSTTTSKSGCTHFKITTTCSTLNGTSSNEMYTNQHLFGGTQVGTSTLYNCLIACAAQSSTCLGIDFNSNDSSCWFHTSTTECTTLYQKSTCTHVRLTDTCSSTTTTTTTTTTSTSTATTSTATTTTATTSTATTLATG